MRKFFFWLHLSSGVIAGLIILIMSLTGVLLTFERQIIAFNERDVRAVPVAGAQRLPMSQLIAAARAHGGGAAPLSFITIASAPETPSEFAFGRELSLMVDPWNGNVLGEGAKKTAAFFRKIEDVHRALAMKGDSRDKGRAITGAANLLFLVIVLSGPILWWPRRWTRSIVRNATWFRAGLRGRARDFNWHNVLGLWSVIPLIAIVASGVVMSYPWANRLVYRLAGSEPPPPPSAPPAQGAPREGGGRAERVRPNDALNDVVWVAAVSEATRRQNDWQTISARMPFAKGVATFTIDSGNGARPDKRSSLKLDAATGSVKEWQPYAAQEAGRKARTWLRWIHTGEAGGIVGQLIAGLASAAAVVLVWTGIALTLRRFRAWRGRGEV